MVEFDADSEVEVWPGVLKPLLEPCVGPVQQSHAPPSVRHAYVGIERWQNQLGQSREVHQGLRRIRSRIFQAVGSPQIPVFFGEEHELWTASAENDGCLWSELTFPRILVHP